MTPSSASAIQLAHNPKGPMMLAAITWGHRVEIRRGSVTLISIKDGTMPDPFPTIAKAYQWYMKMRYG